MKAVPIITALLICQTTFLGYVIRKFASVSVTRLPSLQFDPQSRPPGEYWFQLAISSCFGLMLLCLGLIVVIWRNRLCHQWVLLGLVLLWLATFLSNFSGPVH
jgi:hypothetical protein